MNTQLFLIRHGEVEARYHRVFGGRIDMELSDQGRQQAGRLAHWLAGRSFDAVYASPMRRVQLTLDPFRRHFHGEPTVLPGLREVDFGDWTGFGWDEVQKRFGMSALEWLEHLEADRVPGAEPVAQFRERTGAALKTILSEQAGKTVAVFCHGGVIRMLLAQLLRLPFAWFENLEVEYASATWVTIRQTPPREGHAQIQLANFTPWRDLP
jgi:broad specificity phosphatase PhoE